MDSLIDVRPNVSDPEEKKKVEPTSIQLKILEQEHRFKIEDDKYKDTWVSCCMVLDRRAVMYFTQIAIIGGTITSRMLLRIARTNNALFANNALSTIVVRTILKGVRTQVGRPGFI